MESNQGKWEQGLQHKRCVLQGPLVDKVSLSLLRSGEADDGGNMLQGHTTAAAQAEGPKGDGSKMENGTSSISTQPVQAKTPDGQNQEAVDCLSSPPEPASARAAPNTQYLFLSHNFIHSKLKSFNPPCSIEVQLETDGEGQNSVHQGMLCDSASKGYYCLTAPPRELLLGKEIYGLRLRADGRIILQLRDRSKPLQVDEGRRRVGGAAQYCSNAG
jgi:hypothetical protein